MGAHVVGRGIDLLAPRDSRQHLCRAMPVAIVQNFDQRPVVGFEGIPGVELGHAILEDGLPVGSQVQDAPVYPLSGHGSPDDGNDAPVAGAPVSHLDNVGEFHPQIAKMDQSRLEHDLPPSCYLSGLASSLSIRTRSARSCSVRASARRASLRAIFGLIRSNQASPSLDSA